MRSCSRSPRPSRSPERSVRESAFSLLELAVSVTILSLTFLVIGAAFNSLTRSTAELEDSQVAQNEAARIRVDLTNQLQLTDTLGVDSFGVPYFRIASHNGIADSRVDFRSILGYSTGSGFTPTLSALTSYYVNAENSLVRCDDTGCDFVGNQVRSATWSLTETGVIRLRVVTYADEADAAQDVITWIQVSPRNILKI
jgi:type II secretory pathway component PulJ